MYIISQPVLVILPTPEMAAEAQEVSAFCQRPHRVSGTEEFKPRVFTLRSFCSPLFLSISLISCRSF